MFWNCFESIDFNCILLYVVVVCSFYSFQLNHGINSKWVIFELCCTTIAFSE